MPPRGRNGRRGRGGGHRGGGVGPVGGGGGGGGNGGQGGGGGGLGGNGGHGGGGVGAVTGVQGDGVLGAGLAGQGGGGGGRGGGGGGGHGAGVGGIGHNLQVNQSARTPLQQREIAKAAARSLADQEKISYVSPNQQTTISDLDVLVTSSAFTSASLVSHCQARKDYNMSKSFLKIPVELEDGQIEYVPVTQEKEAPLEDLEVSIEARRHLIVEVVRDADNARCRVVISEHDGYAVAFQIVYQGDPDPDESVYWFLFKKSEKLPTRFKLQRRINYSLDYHSLDHVNIQDATGDQVFGFLETFRQDWDQEETVEGCLYFDTLFLALNEGPRFHLIEEWLHILGQLPPAYVDLIKCWTKLSHLIYLLLLYLAEEHLAANTVDEDHALISTMLTDTRKRTLLRWARMQKRLQGIGMDFFPLIQEISGDEVFFENGMRLQDVVLHESMLRDLTCGRGLNIIKHDWKIIEKIRMRKNGYCGRRW